MWHALVCCRGGVGCNDVCGMSWCIVLRYSVWWCNVLLECIVYVVTLCCDSVLLCYVRWWDVVCVIVVCCVVVCCVVM